MIGRNYRLPTVDAEKCQACDKCHARQACRLKAFVQFESNELPYVDQTLCRGCLVCVDRCPFQAIAVIQVS
jgi:MinD superfamily P-loop ATPase